MKKRRKEMKRIHSWTASKGNTESQMFTRRSMYEDNKINHNERGKKTTTATKILRDDRDLALNELSNSNLIL